MANIDKYVDKAMEKAEFAALKKEPISALQGVSDADAAALQKALGIKSIADLATNKYVLWAQAINTLGS